MAIARTGNTDCRHAPGCPHDIGPAAARVTTFANAIAAAEALADGRPAEGSGPVERRSETAAEREARLTAYETRAIAAREADEERTVTDTRPEWPTGSSDADKRARASVLDWAMRRFEAADDPVGEACAYLGIKRNAASMILRTARTRAESAGEHVTAGGELQAVIEAGLPSVVGRDSAIRVWYPEAPSPAGEARAADALVEAYRVVRELAPSHLLSADLAKAIAVRIADREADRA